MATFTTATASYSSLVDYEPRIFTAKFGDGYEQNTFDGINYNPKKWSLTFQNISTTTATAIILFFTSNNTATTPFDWTDPESVSGKYLCKKWKRTYDGFDQAVVTCEFEEVFFSS